MPPTPGCVRRGAAAGSCDWQTAAGALRRVAGCDVLNVLSVAMDRRIVDADCSGMSGSEKRDYFENWAAMDELAAAAFALPGGTAHSLSEWVTPPAIRAMEVFEAWYVPTGLHFGGVFHFAVPGFGHSAISLFNALERGAIHPDQLRRLDLLGRHFAGALQTAALVASARRQRAGVAAMLAQWSVGLLFCDPDPHSLRRRLGLTPAETDVLWRLMLGEDLPAIAEHRQSSTETVRSCPKGLRRKLDCHTQAQLVAAAWRAVGLVPTARTDGHFDDRRD